MSADAIGLFIGKAQLAGAEIVEFGTTGEAAEYLEGVIRDVGPSQIIAASGLAGDAAFGPAAAGLATRPADGELWIEAGIIDAHFGVAETGTLIRFEDNDGDKNIGTLPDVCYALLDAGRIVARLEDLAPDIGRHLARTDIPSPQISLITGPSRTADIESQLTIGVHGPRRLVILVYRKDG